MDAQKLRARITAAAVRRARDGGPPFGGPVDFELWLITLFGEKELDAVLAQGARWHIERQREAEAAYNEYVAAQPVAKKVAG